MRLSFIFALSLALAQQTLADTSGDWIYRTVDQRVTITRYTGAGGNVLVPNELDGFPVTSIGDGAFAGYTSGLLGVVLPPSVTRIGSGAFAECAALTSLEAGSSLFSIEDAAFQNCLGLTTLSLPDSLNRIGSGAFIGCTGLSSVRLGTDLRVIGGSAFFGCEKLATLTLPDGLQSLGALTFGQCSALTSLVFLQDPSNVEADAFDASPTTIYYLPSSAEAWSGTATFGGRPTALLAPQIDATAMTPVGFTFSWTGAGNIPMNVQRSPSLSPASWTDLAQGITSGNFLDPNPPNSVGFYRLALP